MNKEKKITKYLLEENNDNCPLCYPEKFTVDVNIRFLIAMRELWFHAEKTHGARGWLEKIEWTMYKTGAMKDKPPYPRNL